MQYITSLEDIAPLADQIVIRRKGEDGEKKDIIVPVKPLELNEIGGLIFKHKALANVFGAGPGTGEDAAEEEPKSLFEVIVASGKDVVRDFVDIATERPGLGANLTGVEQGRVVLSCLNMTVPDDEEEAADFLDQIIAFVKRAQILAKAKRT